MVSGAPDRLYCEEALLCGARGFLRKPFGVEQLKVTVSAMASGLSVLSHSVLDCFCENIKDVRASLIVEKRLATREVEVLDLLVCFLPNKVIADRLGVSMPLIQKLLHSAFEKLGAHTRSEAIAIWGVGRGH
jgi:DNA-binding NarL/FixJ family response regulator